MKRCLYSVLVSALLILCGYLLLSAQPVARASNLGVPGAAQQTSAYTITSQVVSYTTPLLITDMRSDQANPAKYLDKESYNIRTLTIYRAEAGGQALQNQPVIFFVHGGAWTDGYAAWYSFVAQSFTGARGWVTVVIDYRLTSDQVFPGRRLLPRPGHLRPAGQPDQPDQVGLVSG